jgi:hypothetical protein
MVAATPGRRRPGRSRRAGGEDWRGEDQEHEGCALNWLEGEEEGGSPVGQGDDRAREEEHGAAAR